MVSQFRFCRLSTSYLSVGNKDDEPEKKVVLTNDAKRIADASGILLFETSAKENRNVEEVSQSNNSTERALFLSQRKFLGGVR